MQKKHFLTIFILAGGLALPWACSNNNNPTSPAPTPTFTAVPTNWAGYTNTFTPTNTPTATATPTGITATFTYTPTFTPTGTFTPPGPTASFTNTPTFTPTVTSTNTATPYPAAVPYNIQGGPSVEFPNGVAYSPSSSYLYVAEGDGQSVSMVQIFNSGLGAVTTLTAYGSTTFGDPSGVAVNSAGSTFYVVDSIKSAVYVFTSNGTAAVSWSSWTGGTFSAFDHPEGIAVTTIASIDHIYVADTDNDTVEEFTLSGTTVNYVNQWDTGTTAFSIPSAVALDGSNNLYVADAGNDLVQIFNGSSWNSWPTDVSYLTDTDIWGIAVDGNQNVYTADTLNNQVEIFSNSGVLESAWTGPSGGSTFVSPDGVALTGTTNYNIWVSDYENGSGTGTLTEFAP